MDISQLEAAFRATFGKLSPQLTLASLASNGQVPAEFGNAARTLAGRRKDSSPRSILNYQTQEWA